MPESQRLDRYPVWVVCQVFYPDEQSTSQLISDVLAGLVDHGYDITVLSGYPGVQENKSLLACESWRGIKILRGGARTAFKRGMLRRIVAYASYSWFVCWRLIASAGGKRVLIVSNPPFAPALIGLICRIRRNSCIFMLQDIYPDGLVAMRKINKNGMIARTWRAANSLAFRGAHEVWVLGRDMLSLIAAGYRVPVQKIRYVPHWSPIEVKFHVRADATRLWRDLRFTTEFVIQYSGNMGLWHDMESIITAAELLQGESSAHFLLIGAGIRRKAAEERTRRLGLKNVTWLPYQSRRDLEDTLRCCHAALISQCAGLEGIAVPCKLYGILASGRAVIAQVPASSEAAIVLREERCGCVVPPGDGGALAKAILELANDRPRVERMGHSAFDAYRRKYTLENGVEAFDRGWRKWTS